MRCVLKTNFDFLYLSSYFWKESCCFDVDVIIGVGVIHEADHFLVLNMCDIKLRYCLFWYKWCVSFYLFSFCNLGSFFFFCSSLLLHACLFCLIVVRPQEISGLWNDYWTCYVNLITSWASSSMEFRGYSTLILYLEIKTREMGLIAYSIESLCA